MKKILKLTLLLATLSNLLVAQTIFDLSAQHFSNSIDAEGKGARYNLPKVYVSTALKYVDGIYALTTSAGQPMDVEIKTPLSNWVVSFNMSYDIYDHIHPIRFTSDTGKTIIISFRWNEIYLNGTRVLQDENLLEKITNVVGSLSKNGNSVTLSVNGYLTKTINVSNFAKLKFVSVSVVQENMYHSDNLLGLSIGTN